MSRQGIKAYVVFLLTGIVIYCATWLMLKAGWISQLPSYGIPILIFFFAITTLIYKYINRFASHGAATEMQFYLASIVLKLLIGCTFLVVLIISDRPQAAPNSVLFLVSYALFTGVEIQQLMAAKKA